MKKNHDIHSSENLYNVSQEKQKETRKKKRKKENHI
jgi:hypothetical protein